MNSAARHVFQGGASATAANDNWVGIDYGYDFFSGRALLPKSLWPFWRALVSHRLTTATDVVSRKRAAKVGTGFASASAPSNMGAMPTQSAYGAANAINQVANVPNRAPMTWTDSGNMQTDGKGY